MSELTQWLQAKLVERGWKAIDLAREAGLGNSTVTRILNEEREAGPDVCTKIAAALGEEPDKVFRLAGLLPESTGSFNGLSSDESEMLKMYRGLPLSRKEALLSILRGLAEKAKKRRQ